MRAKDFLEFKNWVVIGDVGNMSKYAYRIKKALDVRGMNTMAAHPYGGVGIYKSLSEINEKIEVIDLCINPVKGIEYLKEAAKLNIDKVLIQPGAESEEILNFCKENNILAIEGCALVELSKY